MNISVNPEGLRDTIDQINKLKSEVYRIEAEFKRIGASLSTEFFEVSSSISSIEQDFEDIKIFLSKFCEFIDDAIIKYTDADEKVKDMVECIPDLHRVCMNTLATIRQIVPQNDTVVHDLDITDIKQFEKPCPLPSKAIFKNINIRPGQIDGGKNILIRTWASSVN